MLVYQRVLHQQPELLMPGRLRMFPLAWYIRTKGLLARMKPNTTPAGVAFAWSWHRDWILDGRIWRWGWVKTLVPSEPQNSW